MASSCNYKEDFQVQEGKGFQDEEGDEFQVKHGERHVFLVLEGLLIICGHKMEGSRCFPCLGCKFTYFSWDQGFQKPYPQPLISAAPHSPFIQPLPQAQSHHHSATATTTILTTCAAPSHHHHHRVQPLWEELEALPCTTRRERALNKQSATIGVFGSFSFLFLFSCLI